MYEETKEEKNTTFEKENVEQVVEEATETKVEIKTEDISITATDNEGNTVSEAKTISQNEPKEEVKETEKVEAPVVDKTEDTLKVAFIDQQKQLEEVMSQLEGQKKANEELLNKNKALEEKVEKFEKDISELRESPFYKSTATTSDREITNRYENYTADDLKALHRNI